MFNTIDVVWVVFFFFSKVCRINSRPHTGLNRPIHFLNVFKHEAHCRIQYCAVPLIVRIFRDCDVMRPYFWEVIWGSINQDFWFSDSQPGCSWNPWGTLKTVVCRPSLQTSWNRISGSEVLASEGLKFSDDSKVRQGLRTIDLVHWQQREMDKRETENEVVALIGCKHSSLVHWFSNRVVLPLRGH